MKFHVLAFLITAATMSVAHAADFSYSGNIAYHNDVVKAEFTLNADTTNVKVWTDSYQSGTNFDPITAVWKLNGSTWDIVGQNDDNPNIAPGQSGFDSGLVFSSLTAGSYLFTVATYNNFANGQTLAQGFNFDGQAPIALANWNQPSSHLNMGTYWHLNISGVDTSTAPIITSNAPEPETYALLMAGLGLVGFAARRKQSI